MPGEAGSQRPRELLSLTINLGSFSGASAFDIVDDDLGFGGPAYDRSSNSLDAPLWDLSESPGAQLVISSQGSWEVSAFVGGRFTGTYTIAPAIAAVPEPNTFALLVTAVGLLGFVIRAKTHSARGGHSLPLSDAQRHVRARLTVRDALVRTRTRYISLIRALLRQHG